MMRKIIKKLSNALIFWIALPLVLIGLFFYLKAGLLVICIYAFFFLLLSARIMINLWLSPLECKRELSNEVIPIGHTVKVILKIRNPYFWPIFWAYIEETVPGPCR